MQILNVHCAPLSARRTGETARTRSVIRLANNYKPFTVAPLSVRITGETGTAFLVQTMWHKMLDTTKFIGDGFYTGANFK
jgi:hypothetical protein